MYLWDKFKRKRKKKNSRELVYATTSPLPTNVQVLVVFKQIFKNLLTVGRGNAPHPTPFPARSLCSLVLPPPPPPRWKILATPVDKNPVSIYFVLPLPSFSSLPILVLPDWLLIVHNTPPPRVRWRNWYFPQPLAYCVRIYTLPPPPLLLPHYGTGWGVVHVHNTSFPSCDRWWNYFAQPLPGRMKLCLRTLPPPPPPPRPSTPPIQLIEN